jgi:SAM-dependent methyltransferase
MITWNCNAAATTTAVCPMCSARTAHAPVCTVENLFVPRDRLHFCRCSNCDGLWVHEGVLFEYTDHNAITADHARHYLHVGAGIDFMVRPLERVRTDGRQSLLDVGCGYGFTLDYWRATAGGTAVGIEPSGYGRMGRDQLGADIHDEYLADVPELRDRRFDIVYSSEVIEHVADPVAFLAELRRHLSPSGVMVLTTPSAEYVHPNASPSVILAVLSPGLHKFLFSARALDELLNRVGFRHVLVEVHQERLVAFASDHPLRLGRADDARERYVGYLAERAAHPELDPDLRVGLAFRTFKELVNDGRMTEASHYRDMYADLVRHSLGLDALSGPAAVRAAHEAKQFSTYAAHLPYCHGIFLFYLAMQGRHSGMNLVAVANLFQEAEEVLATSVDVAPVFFQEAATLVWLARFERGSALLAAGEREHAIECLDGVIEQEGRSATARPLLRDEVLRIRAMHQRGIAHLQLGRKRRAHEDFTAVIAAAETPAGEWGQASELLLQIADTEADCGNECVVTSTERA